MSNPRCEAVFCRQPILRAGLCAEHLRLATDDLMGVARKAPAAIKDIRPEHGIVTLRGQKLISAAHVPGREHYVGFRFTFGGARWEIALSPNGQDPDFRPTPNGGVYAIRPAQRQSRKPAQVAYYD